MGDTLNAVVPVVFGFLLIVAGAALFVSEQRASGSAEPVDATVLTSEVYDAEPGDAPNDKTDDEYRPLVEYEYAYEGETYTSEDLCPGTGEGCVPEGNTPDAAEAFLEDYSEGETVTAYVQPDDPDISYLVDGGLPLEYLALAGVGAVVSILAGRNLLTE
ncbi:hypothetical protein C479_02631 [Halovivax asiaticus JCM 14624]|uniref:DUF3592 domain-containing protein n=1 Tax=Halovivax asiaticus JCM 14624 TaxID=1227490 RepID=M0BRZ1_9EURY|nr:DUF3592 domain-containing protein [Halovivax asiaticus]ELZ13705.1 hypothetical protein C479_02631 [Halovivax asiaticus JCM 14624]